MTDRRDKSGPWVVGLVPDGLYMGKREWYFRYVELGMKGRDMVIDSSKQADKAIENMMKVRI